VIYLDVAYVSVAIYVCCKCMFQMFQLFQTYVVSVLSRCCICCTDYTRILQLHISYVSAVSDICCKCFIWMAIHICCKRMFVNVSFISDVCFSKYSIRCKRMFVNISFVLDVCFSKSFILQVLHDQAWEVGVAVLACVREAKRVQRPHINAQAHAYCSSMRGRAGGIAAARGQVWQ
jgi:hypothetical protein